MKQFLLLLSFSIFKFQFSVLTDILCAFKVYESVQSLNLFPFVIFKNFNVAQNRMKKIGMRDEKG